MKVGKTLTQLAQEIERRANAKKDYLAKTSAIQMTESGGLWLAGQPENMGVNDYAHGQIAEYTGIPMPYYRKLMGTPLLAENVNYWLARNDERRMVRTLDGNVRAFLSDRYRPLENEDLAEAVLPVLMQQDLIIMSCEITERRLYIKAVDRRIERDVPTGRKLGDGSHVLFDTVCPAITISNSEVGAGALAIETGVYTKACTNLALIGNNLRKYHTGMRAGVSGDVYEMLTDNTRRVTDAAVWMQVRDVVRAAFDAAKFEATIRKLADAAQQKIESDPVQVIERMAKRYTFNEAERGSVLRHLIEGGDLTRYGLHAAVTRASADVESYDRATDLERIGGDIIELPASSWRELAEA